MSWLHYYILPINCLYTYCINLVSQTINELDLNGRRKYSLYEEKKNDSIYTTIRSFLFFLMLNNNKKPKSYLI